MQAMSGGAGGGPMMLMDNGNGHGQHQMMLHQQNHHMLGGQSSSATSVMSTSSMNRSQRCGVCRGCQCKPCGHCTYCQDSPQFGGPGVKKQSCIERRCLRVLENRLQRDAPTFKARVGCGQCEDCRMPDCQICLVCLDKRFFENRYMTGAMCAKKRCNNATSIELPVTATPQSQQQQQQQNNNMVDYNNRSSHKRTYGPSPTDQQHSPGGDYQLLKRRAPSLTSTEVVNVTSNGNGNNNNTITGGGVLAIHHSSPSGMNNGAPPPNGAPGQQSGLPPGTRLVQIPIPAGQFPTVPQALRLIPAQMMAQNGATHVQLLQTSAPVTELTLAEAHARANGHLQHHQQPQILYMSHPGSQLTLDPNRGYLMSPSSKSVYFDESPLLADPFLPPSYAPEMKNAVVLQPL